MKALALLLCFLLQVICSTSGAETERTKVKAPVLGPWLEKNRKEENKRLSGKLGKPVNVSQAIFGGNGASSAQPFFALIEVNTYLCGGTIINKEYVLTSASCLSGVTDKINIRLGYYLDSQSDDIESIDVYGSWHIHPDYNEANPDHNDIAVIYTDTLPLSDKIDFVDFFLDDVYPGSVGSGVSLNGVGYIDTTFTMPGNLKFITLPIVDMAECTKYNQLSGMNVDNNICVTNTAVNSGACTHDEGGPVVYYKEVEITPEGTPVYETFLVGVIGKQPNECPPSVGFPTRVIKVLPHLCWIQEKTGDDFGAICTTSGSICEAKRRKNLFIANKKLKRPNKGRRQYPKSLISLKK